MPSARSTQPRLVTEPTTKPMLAAPRHSRMPTCTRWIGCCALAPAKDATSMVAAVAARMNERRMKKSPADEYDASRESRGRRNPGACICYATTSAAVPDLPTRSDDCERPAKNEARFREPRSSPCWTSLSQIAAKALDAFAGVLQIGSPGRVGNAERRAEPERRALHHRDAFVFQKLGDEILIVGDHLARRRSLADGAGAGRVDIESPLRSRAIDPLGLVEHRHHEIAALLEHLVVRRNEVLRTVEGFDRRPLRDRRRVRGRLRLDRRHRLDQLGGTARVTDAPARH